VIANDLYHQLTQEGFKVFFSRITLEDKIGTAYEPYIFAALNSAKVMVVLGTKPEYFNAVWVKNEWSRFLALVKESNGKKMLVPAYRDMDPYDLPEEFSHLQAQDMSKLGFMQDLIRGIKKITGENETKTTEKVVIETGSTNTAALLKRAFMSLEDKEWEKADSFCEQVLNTDPENADAYLGKLLAEMHIESKDKLRDSMDPFDGSNNYAKAVRFSDSLAQELKADNEYIRNRNEEERKQGLYNNAESIMSKAKTEEDYLSAAEGFKQIPGFNDADQKVAECTEKAAIARKDVVYVQALSLLSGNKECLENALALFKTIPGWRDSDSQAAQCEERIAKIIKDEKDRTEAKAKEKKKKEIIVLVILAVLLIGILMVTVIIPRVRYNIAIKHLESGEYQEAYDIFKELNYEDSSNKANEALEKVAAAFLESGDYKQAYKAFYELGSYNGSMNKAIDIVKTHPEILDVGFRFYYGRYDGFDILWRVLAKEDNRILIISDKSLQYPYLYADYDEVSKTSWKECALRTYLNSDFLICNFNKDERERILTAIVVNDDNPEYGTEGGENTKDKVFLLSIEEAKTCFSSDEDRKPSGGGSWFLRSPGINTDCVAYVNADGCIEYNGSYYDTMGEIDFRPVMWIDIEPEDSK
ncbi:MAG: DUF6273 domain-containing protein, partial [Clostridiales bacterium]|nr:DUF6273 domain-containing protein [Clostridiales bacterium]